MTPFLTRTILALTVLLVGCATSFTGSAKVNGGAEGCRKRCADQGLAFAGMVLMGEYSDGCICRDRSTAATSAGGESAVVGVSLQMAAAAAAQQAQQAALQQQRAQQAHH